jgi:peptidoglycan/xylan/chitin deacetylase (PgdA/CDA1 family)
MAPATLVGELQRTADLLPPYRSQRALVRPPMGRVTLGSIVRAFAAGFTTVLWSLDSDDCRTRDPKLICKRVSPHEVSPGEIVLFHELSPWTLEALPEIVQRLRAARYELATLSDMLGY